MVKRLFNLLITALTSTFLSLAVMTGPASAAVTNPYPVQLEEVLSKYSISKDNIRSQKTLEIQTDDSGDEQLLGYDTYIRFKDCKGYLSIFQHRFGRVEKVYTKGECIIPGIENF